jgi:ADP-ribose pyrophosphatase YjhB (NUDIX family)
VIGRLLSLGHLSLRALWRPVTFGVRAIVEDSEGRIALVRHSYASGWHFPGGGVDCGEQPEAAALREAREEAGLLDCAPAEFLGLYVQRVFWVTNVIALYRLRGATAAFVKSFEIREMVWADPASPPQGTTVATLRRLAELNGKAAKTSVW